MFNKNTTVFQSKQVWPLQGYKRKFMFLSCSNDKILIIEVFEVFFSSISNHQMALMMKSYAFQNHMQPRRVLLEVSLKHVFCKFASKSRYTSSAGFSTLPSQNQVLGPHLTKMCKITRFNYPFAKREKKNLEHFAQGEIKKY